MLADCVKPETTVITCMGNHERVSATISAEAGLPCDRYTQMMGVDPNYITTVKGFSFISVSTSNNSSSIE